MREGIKVRRHSRRIVALLRWIRELHSLLWTLWLLAYFSMSSVNDVEENNSAVYFERREVLNIGKSLIFSHIHGV